MEWLHDIHHYDHQHLKVVSNQMNACYNHLLNSDGFQVRQSLVVSPDPDQKEISAELQQFWEGPYVGSWINNAVYRIQRHPKAKIMVVHLDRLALYLEASREE